MGSAEGEGVPGDASRNGLANGPRWFAAFGDFRAKMLSPCTLTVRVGEGAPEGAQVTGSAGGTTSRARPASSRVLRVSAVAWSFVARDGVPDRFVYPVGLPVSPPRVPVP